MRLTRSALCWVLLGIVLPPAVGQSQLPAPDESARSELSAPGRPGITKSKTIVHIAVELDNKPFKVVSKLVREPY